MSRRGRKGFTLVELLVVIGIIAVLVGILMPTLGSARRQARSVKCLSNLRQIGVGFQMYAQTYKGVFPVARHDPGNKEFPLPATTSLRWQDRVLEFISSEKSANNMADLSTSRDRLMQSSVLWGCPEWSRATGDEVVSGADYARTGYAMNPYPRLGEENDSSRLHAYISSNIPGRYFPVAKWTKSSDRLLLADAPADYISVTTAARKEGGLNPGSHNWWPYPVGDMTKIASFHFWIDGARHAKPGTDKKQTYRGGRYINALFVDGHAGPVSVAEAWNAIVNPGKDTAPQW